MPKRLEGVEIIAGIFLKENPNKKFTIYELYQKMRKKYPEINFSHVVLYNRINEMLKNPESNIKVERIGNYTIIWYEEQPIVEKPKTETAENPTA